MSDVAMRSDVDHGASDQTSDDKPTRVRKWLAIVAKLTSPAEPEKAITAFRAFESLMSLRPDWHFCVRSADAVASACGKIPNYGQLCRPLDAWADKNKPVSEIKRNAGVFVLTDDTAGLSVEVRTWVAYYRTRAQAILSRDGERKIFGMLERYCPDAALFIAKGSTDVDGRAVEEHVERRRGWEDEEEVFARVQRLAAMDFPFEFVALLYAALVRYAPSNLHLLTGVAPEEMILRIERRRAAAGV